MLLSSTFAAAALAIVAQDQVVLRAAPRDSAQQQTMLSQGDSLEVRGEKMDFLQVYDHRRERSGYVRTSQVRQTTLSASEAPELLAVARFVRDTPGTEAMGIAFVAAYLKAAPATAIDAEPFDILGTLADRLARRASGASKAQEALLSTQVDTARHYGIGFIDIERDGRVRLCYEGEAFRRVLALSKQDVQRAHAALAITRSDCIDPTLLPSKRQAVDQWRAEVLDRVDISKLPEYLKNRMHARRASVWASLAFHEAKQSTATVDGIATNAAAQRALDALASVNKAELSEDDQSAYAEAAIRTGAVRWGAQTGMRPVGRLTLRAAAGENGQTCLSVAATPAAASAQPLRCTYGVVWPQSLSVNPAGNIAALAVQPLDGWREMWVLRRNEAGWTVDVLPPSGNAPDLGYVEFAGWVPGGTQMLVAREVRQDGRMRRSFETVRLDSLLTDKKAEEPSSLSTFYRWQDAQWKKLTVSLR